MHERDTPLTVRAAPAEPYIHLDNRGLVLHDGRAATIFLGPTLPWVAQTLEVLLDERRATRHQHQHVLGGFIAEGGAATLFAGAPDRLVTLRTDEPTLAEVVRRLRGR
ncbi:MAG TPA: hypothetical protein VF533_04740 [Solirubrobacteraceae bacterium]